MSDKQTAVQMDDSWKAALADEFSKPYFADIKQSILNEKAKGKSVYPPRAVNF